MSEDLKNNYVCSCCLEENENPPTLEMAFDSTHPYHPNVHIPICNKCTLWIVGGIASRSLPGGLSKIVPVVNTK